MALPAEWNLRTVERIYLDWNGDPMSGTVTFVAAVPVETNDETKVILPRARTGTLDSNGKLSISLPVTDDTDMRNYGFTYKVTENLQYPAGGSYESTYNVPIPSGAGALQLGTLAPIPPSAGTVVVGGTPGKSAYQVAVDNGFVGTEAQWLASLVGPPSTTPGPQGDDGASAYEVWLATHPGGTEADFFLSLKGDPGDVSGLATVASSGQYGDLLGLPGGDGQVMLDSERQTEAILANRVMLQVRYSGGAYETITNSSRLCRVFTGPTDPASAANEDDIWLVTP